MLLYNLDINPKIVGALNKARIYDVTKLLNCSKLEIEKKAGLKDRDVEEVFRAASEAIKGPGPFTAFDIIKGNSVSQLAHGRLPTGCNQIDSILQGGLLYPGVTEIAGESASGKTQLCIQICLNAQKERIGGHNVASVYVCTEDAFPTKRLQQMTYQFVTSRGVPDVKKEMQLLTDNIFIEHASDLDDLWALVSDRLPLLLKQGDVKLLVIDSIAALFRVEFDQNELAKRAQMLAKFGSQLHKLSHKYGVCIICVNQVTDCFDGQGSNEEAFGIRKVLPALGMTWSYHVTTRLLLSRTQYSIPTTQNNPSKLTKPSDQLSVGNSVVRRAKVVFAPHLAENECYFVVTQAGIEDVPHR